MHELTAAPNAPRKSRGRKAIRHLGESTQADEYACLAHVADWLRRRGFAGSLGKDYSLYRAIEREFERARQRYMTTEEWLAQAIGPDEQ
jgi:hypothetical protein